MRLFKSIIKILRKGLFVFLFGFSIQLSGQDTSRVINDITQLNPITVAAIIKPITNDEIIQAVKNHPGPIAIGGGRYSMGGQTATDHALHIDMRDFDSILNFSEAQKEITVQTGITWRKI